MLLNALDFIAKASGNGVRFVVHDATVEARGPKRIVSHPPFAKACQEHQQALRGVLCAAWYANALANMDADTAHLCQERAAIREADGNYPHDQANALGVWDAREAIKNTSGLAV